MKMNDKECVIRMRIHELFVVSLITINGKKRESRITPRSHPDYARKIGSGKLFLLQKNEWMTEGLGLSHEM